MNRKQLIIGGGIVTAASCVVWISLAIQKKRRDRTAAELMRELTKLLNPATSGLLAEDALDIHYKENVLHSTAKQVITLKKETARDYASQLHAAWKAWWAGGDDEQKVYAVFRSLKDKVQVSQVAHAYLQEYQVNLIDKLNERLDNQEIKNVLSIIHPLPAFRTV